MSPLQLAKGIVFSCSFTLLTNPFNFFFLMEATQYPAQFSWELEIQGNDLVWTCVCLNMGSMAALWWETQSKAVFFQTSGKYTVPSPGNI